MNNASQEYEWYLARDGQRYGPITHDDLQKYLSDGQVKGQDLVWRHGFSEWTAAQDVPELNEDHGVTESTSVNMPFQGADFSDPGFQEPAQTELSEPSQHELRADPSFRVDPNQDLGQSQAAEENFTPHEAVIAHQEMQQPMRRKSFARRFFSFMLFILVIGGLTIFALPALVPADFIRERLARVIKEQTGRTLTVRGKTTFSIVPHLGVRMQEASLSNPPGMVGEPLLQTETLEVQLKPWPLLERRVEIQRVILKQPKLAFKSDGKGRRNWDFEKPGSDGSEAETDGGMTTLASNEDGASISIGNASSDGAETQQTIDNIGGVSRILGSPIEIAEVKLEQIEIVGGQLSYQDEKTGFAETLSDVNVKVNLTSAVKRLIANGTGVLKNQKIEYAFSITSPQSIMNGEKAPYSLTLKSPMFSAILLGEVSWADGIYLTGEGSELQVASVRNLSRWLDHEIAPGSGMESFSIRGNFSAQSHRVALTNATISLDNTSATGEATLILAGKRPFVKASLAADTLDLNPYFNETPLRESSLSNSDFQYVQRPDSATLFRQANQGDDQYTDNYATGGGNLFDSDGEQVSARPINSFASSLKLFDADIKLAADKVIYEDVLIGKSRALMKVRDGVMITDFQEINLYSGVASGKLQVSSPSIIPLFSGELNIQNVDALPLLKDMQNFNWVSGRANAQLTMNSRGHTKKQILSSLKGKGKVDFNQGAIVGIDIPKKLREIRKGKLSELSRNENERTRFDRLGGTFTISKGIIRNRDLKLEADNVAIDAGGKVDLTRSWIDYRVEPNLGTNNRDKANRVSVPVVIKGPIERPTVNVDLNRTLVKNQDAIAKGLNNVVKTFNKYKKKKKIDFESLIQDALGKNDDDVKENNEEQKPELKF